METFSDTCVLAPSVTSTVTSKDITHLLDLGFDVEQLDLSLFEVKKEGYEDKQPPFYENAQLDSKAYTSLPPYPSAIKSEASSGGGMLSPPPMVVSSDMSSSSPPMDQSVFQHPGCHRSLSDMNIGYEMQVPESSVHSKSQSRYIPKNSSSSDRQFTAADSNSSTPPKSFIACKVCGDKASGYHYGVTSCEGCKGFFRRSIQKQIEYRCLREGKCLVIRLNRNRCQFCRFKKCLSVGMSRDSVRYGRVPKRSRERNDESRVTQSEVDQCFQDQENKEVIMYDLILTVSQAHHANCAYTEEKTRGLVRKPAMFNMNDFQSNPGDVHVTADSLEQQKINVWQQFSVFLTPSIQRIVEFAKRVPGFSDLAQDDQIILVKFAFFEIWLVHVARMVNTVDNTITFYDGSYISQQHLELIFDHDFVSQIFNFVASFNNLQLEDSEIGLYSAVVLLTCDRPGIYDNKAVQQQQEKLMEALKIQVSRNHPGDMHVFHSLIAKLPELNNIGEKHLDHLRWYRENWVRLRIPPLFAEVFDIPKSDVELAQR